MTPDSNIIVHDKNLFFFFGHFDLQKNRPQKCAVSSLQGMRLRTQKCAGYNNTQHDTAYPVRTVLRMFGGLRQHFADNYVKFCGQYREL